MRVRLPFLLAQPLYWLLPAPAAIGYPVVGDGCMRPRYGLLTMAKVEHGQSCKGAGFHR